MTPELGEKCGVFAVAGAGFDAARIIYPGLYALQHRGQESSGIAVAPEGRIRVHKGMGLVAAVYDEEDIQSLPGETGIGHNRYATSEKSIFAHAQPVIRGDIGGAHNGNLPSTKALEEFFEARNISVAGLNDSEMMTEAIWYHMRRGATVEEAIRDAYPLFTGAFSLVILSDDKVIALRDPHGIRPISIGKLNGGYIFSSETCALDTVHAMHIGDVLPGQMVIADKDGNLQYEQIVHGQQHLDIFEFVYFARPDSMLLGKRVHEVRRNLGIHLYNEQPMRADMVISVPDSGTPAALGYAEASGILYREGFIKNRYIHRTFIEPEQYLREKGLALKLNLMPETVKGKIVIIIDDSIVRGTTTGTIVKRLKDAGAKQVHVKISSPPVLYPDFYGIDTPDQHKLIAATMSVEEIREKIGADSLQYLSYHGLIEATGLSEEVFSTSCFTGIYPIDIGERRSEIIFERRKVYQYDQKQ